MNRIEQAFVAVESLVVSDAFESRLGQQHVAQLAESIRELGLIHPSVVRASDMQVIAGEDRIAAQVLLGRDEVLVDLVECSDEQVLLIRAAENDRRRSPKEIKAMVEALTDAQDSAWAPLESTPVVFGKTTVDEAAATFTALDRDEVPAELEKAFETFREPKPRGRPKTARGKAVEEAAKALGTTTNAIRKKLQKAKEPSKETAPPFETWGREVDEKLVEEAAKAYRSLTTASSHVQAAMSSITAAQKGASIRDAVATPMWEQLQVIMLDLKAARPAALCPWCKAIRNIQKACAACVGRGFILEGDLHKVPKELKAAVAVTVNDKNEIDLGF